MEDLKEVVKDKNLVIGSEITVKKLRNGTVKIVFVAKNCPEQTQETIERYAKLSNAKVVHLDIDNDELGVRAKKPYSISVLAV